MIRCLDSFQSEHAALYHGDCVDVLKQWPAQSIGFSIFSPPFSNLFIYSDSIADMGNSEDDAQFFEHYGFLVAELARVTKPGRLVAVHCSDLPYHKWRDGFIGIKDFSGRIIEAHEKAGFVLHSRVTIWRCPVVEMTRTKALGLLYKQLRKDSARVRQGMPDYLCVFRAPGENTEPITHTVADFPLEQWQEWASPVWMEINQSNTLNVEAARDPKDERHICPLQMDLITRALILWSNPEDTVLSPFAGIGSEGVCALRTGRRFVGIELKESYFKQATKYLAAEDSQFSLSLKHEPFAVEEAE